ncbi:hypothetical protein [Pseudoalteromonas carrageenovora]|uniref:hypothetical protein n=1 Tax=Pseudoalteromonas carrageenovora TaxID=227 RepID=UPI0026E48560|nr:hypothetical protein [Pseudoalteromonas carrageenovora]MDO6464910.1 hypothetical protein [Pseudoalteromonas carrageenovora]
MDELLELIITPVALIAVFTYLGQKFIEHNFKSREKEYELTLKSQFDKEVIKFKSDVEKASLRFNTKVTGVFERQASAISEIYSQLYDLEYSMGIAINQGMPWDEKYEKFKACYFSFREYWGRNRILIPKDVDKAIEQLLKDAFWSVENYGAGEHQFLARNFEAGSKQKAQALELQKSIPIIMDNLRNSFRNTIGVTD